MTDGAATVGDTAVDLGRRKFLTVATTATAAVGAVFTVSPFIASWEPSERARAMGAPVSVDLTKLEDGQMVIYVWRRQPIYVFKRAPGVVSALAAHDNRLKDPKSLESEQPPYAKNERRSRRDEVAVLIGICTHLGCLPKQRFEPGDAALGADWPGGFLCPCHGSRFDLAGRVFNGSPASTNLRVPPYRFPNDNTLLIGEDDGAAQGAA